MVDLLYIPGKGIDLRGGVVTGNAQLAQRCTNRIEIPRGRCIGDPSLGVSVSAYLARNDQGIQETFRADAEAEIRRETGCEDARCEVTSLDGGISAMRIVLPFETVVMPLASLPVVRLPPTITSVIPATGDVAGGTVVTITGTHFDDVIEVRFGGIAGVVPAIVTRESSTILRVVTAPFAAGAVDVSVATLGGTATAVAAFTYTSAAALPTISGVTPGRISVYGGTPITLTGTGFTGATLVTLGGTACTSLVVVSPTTITCVAPIKAAGSYAVAVTTPAGTGSLASAVTVTTPAALALSVFQVADDWTGTVWPGRASAGTSGPASPAFSLYSTPTVSTTPSGRGAGRCGAGLGAAAAFKFGTLGDFFAVGAGTLVLSHRVQGASTNFGSNADGAIFADVAGFARITASSAALAIRSEIDSGGVAATFTPSGWHVYALRWNQSLSKYEVRINRGAWTSVTKTTALSLVSVLYMGLNPVNGNFLDWSVGTIFSAKTALSNADVSDLEQAAADYAGISI